MATDDTTPLERDQLANFFERAQRSGDGLIGTEQEKFLVAREDGQWVPARWDPHVRSVLEAMVERFGWQAGPDRGTDGEVVSLIRDGASITLEPGGQFELSGAPLPTVHDTCAEFTTHYREIHEIAVDLDLRFVASGFHPFASRDEINWMPKGRYGVMRNYLPTRGERALDMMTRTCTVQANFDYTDETTCGKRFRMAMATSSLLTAMFANSPYVEGQRTPFASQRSETWESVDPDRCGLLPWVFEETFSYERYVDWVLDVPMFFVKREGEYLAHHRPFRHYLEHGFQDDQGRRHVATQADWELHLSTVFPEVRLKPFIEVRGADSIGSRWICALPAFCKGILYCERASAEAWELVADLDFAGRIDLWREARRHALQSDRVRGLVGRLLEISRRSLEELDVRDDQGRTEARFLDPLDEELARGTSPANAALPGVERPTRAQLINAFLFAGDPAPE